MPTTLNSIFPLLPTVRQAAAIAISAFLGTLSGQVSALEVSPGDYEMLPPEINLGLVYYQHAETSSAYARSSKISEKFNTNANVLLLRYIKPITLSETSSFDFNLLLPYADVETSGDASASGYHGFGNVGDIFTGGAFKFLLDKSTNETFSIGTFVYLPTGTYSNDGLLSAGEGRWKSILQLAYVKHFNTDWALDLVGDVEIHGANRKFTAAKITRKQNPLYEFQSHVRYKLSPATAFALGIGAKIGGQNVLNGVTQEDKLSTTYMRLTATHWINQKLQVQMQIGQDLSVENGPKESKRFNLRLARVF